MRNLATVQKVIDIRPIPNADRIEVATVLGWECVVAKKDGFKVGDLVIYIEVDSIVPDRPEYEFLRDRKFRVRTIKLRGQVSQGLVLPLHYLNNYYDTREVYDTAVEGMDVTGTLGIKKYDPQADLEEKMRVEAQLRSNSKVEKFFMKFSWYRRLFNKLTGKYKSGFPSFIKKTDEVRVQVFSPDTFRKLGLFQYTFTEKLDGQSATYFMLKKRVWFRTVYTFGVCSRNLYLTKADNSTYWRIAKKLNLEEKMKSYVKQKDLDVLVIQGEIVGEGIQKNKYKLDGIHFFGFNIKEDQRSLGYVEQSLVSSLYLKINLVPLIDLSVPLPETVQELVELSKGKSVLADIPREGIVIRNYFTGTSFKVINPDFLLKFEGEE